MKNVMNCCGAPATNSTLSNSQYRQYYLQQKSTSGPVESSTALRKFPMQYRFHGSFLIAKLFPAGKVVTLRLDLILIPNV